MVALRVVAKEMVDLCSLWLSGDAGCGREGEGGCVRAELAGGDEIEERVGVAILEELVQKLAH
jgi:hypothetical protein